LEKHYGHLSDKYKDDAITGGGTPLRHLHNSNIKSITPTIVGSLGLQQFAGNVKIVAFRVKRGISKAPQAATWSSRTGNEEGGRRGPKSRRGLSPEMTQVPIARKPRASLLEMRLVETRPVTCPVEPQAFSIAEFCARNRISLSTFHKLKNQGRGSQADVSGPSHSYFRRG
jgi:hypothetical protein